MKIRIVAIGDEKVDIQLNTLKEAENLAKEHDLDLVAFGTIYKIIDHADYLDKQKKAKYRIQKEKKQAAKAQRVKRIKTKEVKIAYNTFKNDLDRKNADAAKWLEEGHRVKVSLRLRGRSIMFKDQARKTINNFVENLEYKQINRSNTDRTFTYILN